MSDVLKAYLVLCTEPQTDSANSKTMSTLFELERAGACLAAFSRQINLRFRIASVCTFLNLATASECEMCAATLQVVASAASSTRKKRESALVTVYPPALRSTAICSSRSKASGVAGGDVGFVFPASIADGRPSTASVRSVGIVFRSR